MDHVKIKDNPELVRDQESNGILNTDTSGLEAYRAIRNKKLKEEQRIDKIERDLDDIKSMLKQLIGN